MKHKNPNPKKTIPHSIKLQMLNEKYKNLEHKHQQDRDLLMNLLTDSLKQQKSNENYMQDYYENFLGNPMAYHQMMNGGSAPNLMPSPMQDMNMDMNNKNYEEDNYPKANMESAKASKRNSVKGDEPKYLDERKSVKEYMQDDDTQELKKDLINKVCI